MSTMMLKREISRLRARRMLRRRQQRCLFNTPFEEMKALQYLYNLLTSTYLVQKPLELCMLCSSLCGTEGRRVLGRVIDRFMSGNPEAEDRDAADRLMALPVDALIETMQRDIIPIVMAKLKKLSARKHSSIDQRIRNVQSAFKLSKEEVEILTFVYVVTVNDVLRDAVFNGNEVEIFANLLTFRNKGHLILGMKKAEFLRALDRGTLFGSYILEERHLDFEMSSWCIRYISGVSSKDLSPLFFSRINNERLTVRDFSVQEGDLEILEDLLQGRGPVNILIHGVQGSGKSSYVRALAKHLGKELFTVNVPESGEERERICALKVTLNLADKDNCVVLVDEADELLNSRKSFFFDSDVKKSQINAILESHDRKVIWITNRTGQIDPSTIRRFSFVLEFRNLSVATRLRVLASELRRKRLRSFFKDEDLAALCQNYAVNADGIIKAVRALAVAKARDRSEALRKMRRVLGNHERSLGGDGSRKIMNKDFVHYDLRGLNASEDLDKVISAVKAYAGGKDKGDGTGALTLLLYGPPGTGKSEFVHYLAHVLENEVVLRRSSDILGKYVGENETRIREAFEDAREEGKILFFDEADSFLYPRAEASHSWEKSLTNEILAQLDVFDGIAVFATNEINGLDHAALRRFRFKIEFRPLTPDGALLMYERLLCSLPMVKSAMTDQEKVQVRNLPNLRPGDFAVVRDKYRFFRNEEVTHEELIADLKREIAYKKGTTKHVGFTVTTSK